VAESSIAVLATSRVRGVTIDSAADRVQYSVLELDGGIRMARPLRRNFADLTHTEREHFADVVRQVL
jgi:hypothetical protein